MSENWDVSRACPKYRVFLETNESHVIGKDGRRAQRNGTATLVAKTPILRDGKRARRNAVLQSAASPSSPVVEFPSLISGSSSSSSPCSPLPLSRPHPSLGPSHGRPVSLWVSRVALLIPAASFAVPSHLLIRAWLCS